MRFGGFCKELGRSLALAFGRNPFDVAELPQSELESTAATDESQAVDPTTQRPIDQGLILITIMLMLTLICKPRPLENA